MAVTKHKTVGLSETQRGSVLLNAARDSSEARLHGNITVKRRAHERGLDATLYTLLVRPPEALWQLASRDASVDLPCLGQLGRLDDCRVDHVRRRDVVVALAAL